MSKLKNRKFVIVPENMILNKNISYSSIGVFAFLNLFEDGATLPDLKDLSCELKELEKFGYIEVKNENIHLRGI